MAEVPFDPIDPGDDDLDEAPAADSEAGDADNEPAGSKQAVLADLARERKTRQALEARLKELEEATQTEAEKAIAAAKAEGRTEALSVANARLLQAEVKAAAGGVLQDPDDAVRLLDLEGFEISDDGIVDTKAIKAAVQRLADAKPYLAVGAKPTALPGGGAMPSQGSSMDDLIRRAARGGKGL